VNGKLQIDGDFGKVAIDMVNADIILNGQTVNGMIDAVNADVDIESEEIENLAVDCVNGDVEIIVNQGEMDMDIDTVSAKKTIENIDIKKSASGKLDISLTNGSVYVKGNR